jgi:hypothetical protein
MFAGGRAHAPDQRVAVVLRQQGQRPFVGEALEGAVRDRLVGCTWAITPSCW